MGILLSFITPTFSVVHILVIVLAIFADIVTAFFLGNIVGFHPLTAPVAFKIVIQASFAEFVAIVDGCEFVGFLEAVIALLRGLITRKAFQAVLCTTHTRAESH